MTALSRIIPKEGSSMRTACGLILTLRGLPA
jgi:hypothetical protein